LDAPLIQGNEIHECVIGVTIFGNLAGGDVLDNDIHDCSFAGVEINQSNNLVVDNNVFTACGNSGGDSHSLHAWTGTNNEFTYNEVINQEYYGIFLEAQTNILVDNNIVRDAPGSGAGLIVFGILGSGDNYVTNNEIYNLTWSGLFVQGLGPNANMYVNNNTVHDITVTDWTVGIVQQLLEGHLESFDNVITT
jgi:parallel beta-helix repeat protein